MEVDSTRSEAAPNQRPRPGRRRFGALLWATAMDSGGQAVSLLLSVVLAALLGPEVFGLVAMALVFVMFIQLVQRQGLQAAVIQRRALDETHKDTAFWMVALTSLVLTGVSLALAGWWAGVNGEPRLAPVLMALSALLPVQALSTVQEALLRRSLRFKALAVRTLVAVSAGGAAGVTGAVLGWGVWALVAQQLTTAFVGVVLLWCVSAWRPRLHFSRAAARDLLGFSTGSFLSSLAVFVNNKADALLIGVFFGPVVVGVYRFGGKLVDTVVDLSLRPVQSVALPDLARHQDDMGAFRRRMIDLFSTSGWLGIPLLGVLAGAAEPVVQVLGAEWEAAEWPLRILCVVGLVRIMTGLGGPVLQAKGLAFFQAAGAGVTAVASVTSFVAAALVLRDESLVVQATGIAVARATVYGVLIVVLHVAMTVRATGVGVGRLLKPYLPSLGAGLACGVLVQLTDVVVAAWGVAPFLRLVVAGVVGAAAILVLGRRHLAALVLRRVS